MDPGPTRHPRLRRALLAPVLAMLLLLASAGAAQASTIVVNTTSDAPPVDGECSGNPGDCSLRQAVDVAQSGDIIQLGANTYGLTLGTDIEIAQSLTIEGSGAPSTSIDGSKNSGTNLFGATARILRTDAGATVTIENLTLTGGDDGTDEVTCNACNTVSLNGGGALWNDGATVNIDDVAFTNNPGGPVGGGVSTSGGTVNLTDVSFTGDQAAIGGALFTHYGTVNGNGVTFENDATGCCNLGAVYLLGGTVSFTNTTVVGSGGPSSIGGGIHNGGASLTLTNDTLSGNIRGQLETDSGASTTVENTIIANGFSEGDGNCVAPGKQDDATQNGTSGPAITTDLGHNVDQDGSCNLHGTGDSSKVDPKLAPIADNTGPTRTQALLAGSPGMGDPSSSDCPSYDQRGRQRPDGSCDIGAFEAVQIGAPTATTGGAQNVGDSSADLSGTINLHGEAGGYHFLYGTKNDPADFTASPEVAAGVPDGDTAAPQTLSKLTPATTYYYEVVADNATASTPGGIQQFTTAPGPPVISPVTVASVTDTTATITFSIDPEGSDTKYLVAYGPDENYGYFSQPTDLGSTPGPQDLSVTLTGLTPNSTYHFAVYAGNDVQHGVNSGDMTFNTFQQLTGVAGSPVTVTDTGFSDEDCPTPDSVTVDWGDDSSDNGAQIQCQYGQDDQLEYTLSDTHTYTSPGDYLIQITYNDFGTTTDVYAHITPSPSGLQNTGLPQISGTAQQGQPLTTTDGAWNGNPNEFDYQWQDCAQNGQNCTDTGTDSNSYTPGQGDVGRTIQVIVTATNALGSLSATSAPTATVLPQAPDNKALPRIEGTAQEGQMLHATNGAWDGDPSTFDYQWQDCDQDGQNCSDTGDDANSYTLTGDDVGHTIRVIVTAHNGGGPSAPATSGPTETVLRSAPTNTGEPIVTGTAQDGQMLSTTNGAWDGDPGSFDYQWQDCDQNGQNCTDAGTDASTYTLGQGDIGHTVQVLVTATNDGGQSTPATSNLTAVVQPHSPARRRPTRRRRPPRQPRSHHCPQPSRAPRA